EALVAEGAQAALGGEIGERRRLVVAALGKAPERLLGEDVDPAVHPVRDAPGLSEAGHDVVLSEVDEAEGRGRPGDGNRRRCAAAAVMGDESVEVDVEE